MSHSAQLQFTVSRLNSHRLNGYNVLSHSVNRTWLMICQSSEDHSPLLPHSSESSKFRDVLLALMPGSKLVSSPPLSLCKMRTLLIRMQKCELMFVASSEEKCHVSPRKSCYSGEVRGGWSAGAISRFIGPVKFTLCIFLEREWRHWHLTQFKRMRTSPQKENKALLTFRNLYKRHLVSFSNTLKGS